MQRNGTVAPVLGAIALALVAVLVTLAALALLVAAGVTALIPHVGLPGALAIIGLVLVALVGVLTLVIRSNLRAAQARARAAASSASSIKGLAELVLLLMPKAQTRRLIGGVQLGLGLALIVLPMLRRNKG
jgi:hypothetical protein